MQQTLKSLLPEYNVSFFASEGSAIGAALVAAATLRLRSRTEQMSGVLAPLQLSMEILEKIRNQMRQEMAKGLSKETHDRAIVRMLPTFVRHLPDGSGEGQGTELWGPIPRWKNFRQLRGTVLLNWESCQV